MMMTIGDDGKKRRRNVMRNATEKDQSFDILLIILLKIDTIKLSIKQIFFFFQ